MKNKKTNKQTISMRAPPSPTVPHPPPPSWHDGGEGHSPWICLLFCFVYFSCVFVWVLLSLPSEFVWFICCPSVFSRFPYFEFRGAAPPPPPLSCHERGGAWRWGGVHSPGNFGLCCVFCVSFVFCVCCHVAFGICLTLWVFPMFFVVCVVLCGFACFLFLFSLYFLSLSSDC